jgi:hypothetical protein
MTLTEQNRSTWRTPLVMSRDVTLSTTNGTRSGKAVLSVTAPRKRIGEVEIWLPSFLTLALHRVER